MIPNRIRDIRRARELATAHFVKDMFIHEIANVQKSVFEDIFNMLSDNRIDGASVTDEQIEAAGKRLFNDNVWNEAMFGNRDSDVSDPIVLIARKITQDSEVSESYRRVIDHFNTFNKMNERLSDKGIPKSDIEIDRLKRAAYHFEDVIPKAFSRSMRMYSKERKIFEPETLILQGGGEKGVGYAGVINVLDATGRLPGIKHIAGTSAGALMGLPVALGFASNEIEEIVKNGRFAQFFSQSTALSKLVTGASLTMKRIMGSLDPSKTPYLEGFNLTEFSRKFMVPDLSAALGISVKDLKKMSDTQLDLVINRSSADIDSIYSNAKEKFKTMLENNNRSIEIGVLHFSGLPGRSESLQAAVTSVRSLRAKSHPENDIIESFIGDIIESGVSRYVKENPRTAMSHALKSTESIRNMTFTDLKGLALETDHKKFKEFGVAITRSHIFKLTWIPRAFEKTIDKIKSIAGHPGDDNGQKPVDKNTNFEPVFVRAAGNDSVDMPIKKAVRISMNLPVLFGSIEHNGGKYYDGGINNNYPHRVFMDKYDGNIAMAEEQTIGFMLSPIESDMENATIDKLVNVAKKHVNIELEKHPNTVMQKLKEAGSDAVYFFMDYMKNIKNLEAMKIGKKNIGAIFYPVGKSLGFLVNGVMNRNNAAIPSERILANTGVINTGSVGTADFHLDIDGKNELIAEGENAALRMLERGSDSELMYSWARLLSIIKAENRLIKEEGYTEVINIPEQSIMSPYAMMDTMRELNESKLDPAEVLAGVMSDINLKKIDRANEPVPA